MESIQDALKDSNKVPNVKTEIVGDCPECRNGTLPNGQPEPKRQLIKLVYADGTEKEVPCVCHQERKVNAKQREINANIYEQGSMLYGDYKNKTFDGYEPANETQTQALKLSKYYASHFDDQLKNGQNIFFQGTFGTGKTHLAAAIRKAVAEQHYTVLFMSLPDYLDKVKLKFNNDQRAINDSEKILKMAKNAELLILDDVGANRMTDFEVSELFKLVDARRGKCSIYTTNYSSEDFTTANKNDRKNMELHRVFSRMMENTKAVVIKGNDYRMRGLM